MQVSTVVAQRGTRFPYKWIVTVVVMFGAFMSICESNDCLHCHSAPATCLWCGPEPCQWVLTAYILTQGIVTPTAAYFVNWMGTRRSISWLWPCLPLAQLCVDWPGACLSSSSSAWCRL